jgi:hypothetical protein
VPPPEVGMEVLPVTGHLLFSLIRLSPMHFFGVYSYQRVKNFSDEKLNFTL